MTAEDMFPEASGQPLFATEEDYQKFRQAYMDEVGPKLEEWRKKRAACNF